MDTTSAQPPPTWRHRKTYREKRDFFRNLEREQRRIFRALLHANVPGALLTRRYYRFWSDKREKKVSQTQAAKELGIPGVPNDLSVKIGAVIHLLDHTSTVSKPAKAKARRIQSDFKRKAKQRQKRRREANIPLGLPDYFRERSRAVRRSFEAGEFEVLTARQTAVLILRWGLEDGLFRTHKQVANALPDVTSLTGKSAIQQDEKGALEKLGIKAKGKRKS